MGAGVVAIIQSSSAMMEYSSTHVNRLSQGECKLQSSIIFIDILNNLEKVGDHLVNIAQAVAGRLRWNGEIEIE